MLSYILLQFGIIDGLMGLLANLNWFPIRHIDDYTLTYCISTFKSQLLVGQFDAGHCFGILLFIVIGVGSAVQIYKKRELEF